MPQSFCRLPFTPTASGLDFLSNLITFARKIPTLTLHHTTETLSGISPVTCMGMFDGVHLGHKHLLQRLTTLAADRKKESLLITFWPHPRQVLFPDQPGLAYLNTLQEKLTLLEEAGIDHVLVLPFTWDFSRLSACEFIAEFLVKQLSIDFLLVGFNHHFGRDRQGSVEDLLKCQSSGSFGIEKQDAIVVDHQALSSSLIRNLLHEGKVDLAKSYLGYSYFVDGKVIAGNRIGRSIGFPTANLEILDPHKLIPALGVYAVYVRYRGINYKGMLNVGFRPTIEESEKRKSVEVHLFDFNHDLYEQEVRLTFVRKLRDEQKFASVDELKLQLEVDKQEALKLL
jgi:riboflavin kinase / FMN adenylyltransferase